MQSKCISNICWLNEWVKNKCYAKSLQSCPTLCDPIDGSPPGSLVPGVLQARTLEWVAISFSNAWKWKVKVKPLSRAWLFATSWTAAHQAPLSVGFSRLEYWSVRDTKDTQLWNKIHCFWNKILYFPKWKYPFNFYYKSNILEKKNWNNLGL